MKLSCCALILSLSWSGPAAAIQAQQPPVNPDARVLADYTERIDKYMELRKRLARQAPAPKPTDKAAEIKASQEALAAKIREARAGAKQGEIFTPEASRLFRRLLSSETTGRGGTATRKAIEEDAPAKIALEVNAAYPEGQPLPTVPPNVLATLPQLPEDLEYRVIHRHLILRDVGANIILDVLPDAIR